jgi:hypothetical protein
MAGLFDSGWLMLPCYVFLRKDECFTTAGLESSALSFEEESSNKRRIDENRKVLIPGTATAKGSCRTGSMCGMDFGKRFASQHFVAFREDGRCKVASDFLHLRRMSLLSIRISISRETGRFTISCGERLRPFRSLGDLGVWSALSEKERELETAERSLIGKGSSKMTIVSQALHRSPLHRFPQLCKGRSGKYKENNMWKNVKINNSEKLKSSSLNKAFLLLRTAKLGPSLKKTHSVKHILRRVHLGTFVSACYDNKIV